MTRHEWELGETYRKARGALHRLMTAYTEDSTSPRRDALAMTVLRVMPWGRTHDSTSPRLRLLEWAALARKRGDLQGARNCVANARKYPALELP